MRRSHHRLGWFGLSMWAVASASAQFNVFDTINVVGFGNVATETDYIPNVVYFENGLASFEALKAQAVAARSYAYYKMRTGGSIQNGTQDQVYFRPKAGSPGSIHYAAAAATAGEVLSFNGTLTAAFYVAGMIPGSGDNLFTGPPTTGSDPTTTERWVTYPWLSGQLGTANRGTPLGFQGAPANRGAKSQNGADWFSDRSTSYLDILKYYYGGDIQVETAITAAANRFPTRVISGFDDYGSGRAGDGIINGHEGLFGWSPTLSGSNLRIAGATADRVETTSYVGSGSQRITIDYSGVDGDGQGFLLRHLAGTQFARSSGNAPLPAATSANVEYQPVGSIGLWMKTQTPGLSVSLAIDQGDTERGYRQALIADGQWRRYQWDLTDALAWEAFAGNGVLTGSQFTLDSLQLFGDRDAEVYLDEVFVNSAFTAGATGDYDGSGTLASEDIDRFFAQVNAEVHARPMDLDADGTLTGDDLSLWLSLAGSMRGDADLDGDVDVFDASTLAANFTGRRETHPFAPSWRLGNFDGDGDIDFLDAMTVRTNMVFTEQELAYAGLTAESLALLDFSDWMSAVDAAVEYHRMVPEPALAGLVGVLMLAARLRPLSNRC